MEGESDKSRVKNPFQLKSFKSTLQIIKKDKNAFLLVIILFVIAAIFIGYRYSLKFNKIQPLLKTDLANSELVVLYARPSSYGEPNSFSVRFNSPVDLHDLSHKAAFYPQIKGKWVNSSYNEYIYYFSGKFKGRELSFYLPEGLKSTDNKVLLSDYEEYFTVNQDIENQENLSYEDKYYPRVKSYAQGTDIPVTDIDSVSIYRSDSYNLLSFLTYSLSDNSDRGSIYDGTFLNTTFQHNESDRLQNLNFDKVKNTLTLDPGIYYVDHPKRPYFIVVNSFGVTLRQDDKKLVVAAFNLKDSSRIDDDITFGLYNLKNNVTLISDFVYSGENNFKEIQYPLKLDAVLAIYKNQAAFIPVEILTSAADINVSSNLDTNAQIFLYTDRPIYKPGDTVFVRGIVRSDSDSLYKTMSLGTPVYLRSNEKLFENKSVAIDEFGSFYTHFVIPKDYKVTENYGYPNITVDASIMPFSSKNYRYSTVWFEVMNYKKPEFEIKTSVEKPEYLASDKLRFTISGNYFNGTPLAGNEIEYTLYSDNYYETEKAVYNENFNISGFGGMCGGGGFEDYLGIEYKTGKVKLDNNGKALIEESAFKDTSLSQEINLLAKIKDKNGNELVSAVSTIVHASEFNIFFIPSATDYYPGEEVVAPFYAESLTGDKMSEKEFEYEFITTIYDSSGKESQKEVIKGQTKSDGNGKGIIKFNLPTGYTSGNRMIVITGNDTRGNAARSSKVITLLNPKEENISNFSRFGDRISSTYLKISSNQNSFKVNDTVNLNIESPRDLDVLMSYERGRVYSPRIIRLTKGMNEVSFKVTEDLSPSVAVVFSFFSNGKYYTEGLSLNVPAMHKLLDIDLSLNKEKYNPSETAELTVSTKDSLGFPVAAQMSVGIIDKAIYALRKSATPPVHSSFYYFRSRSTNASSSLTGLGFWGGGGMGGGGGGETPGKAADILYWNPNLRTDNSGVARVPIPLLGYETTWKISVLGTTLSTDVGQADMEFIVSKDVKGAKIKRK